MRLTRKQKKFIKHNKKKLSSTQIANNLRISEEEVLNYLKEQLSEEDYRNSQLDLKGEKKTETPLFYPKQFLKKNWPVFLIFILLVGIAYVNSLNNAFVSDDLAIYQIKNLGTPTFIFSTPFHFIGNLFYSLAYKIGGYNPLFYRLSNIIFHIGAVVGVYILLSILVNDFFGFIVASLFAVHPILIESFAWISGFQYVQYGFFCLWALIAYILFQQNKKIFYLFLSIMLFVLALLSSEKAIVFPLIIPLYEISYGDLKKNWKYTLIFILITLSPTVFYLSQIPARLSGLVKLSYQQNTTSNPLFQIPVAITSYLQLIVWPDKLTLYHSEPISSLFELIIRWIIFLCFLITTIYGYIKNKPIFFWLCFFIISLLPTLTPFGISWIVAERYVYLGSVGIFFLIGYLLMKLMANKKTETIGYLLFIIIIISLLTRTIIRNFDWKNEDNIWIATGKTSPSDPKTHNNLGDVYGRQGDLEKSAEEFKTAIRLNTNYADAYHNLGNVYSQMKKYEEAMKNYLTAIKYNPELWQSYQNLSVIYFNQKQYDLAEKTLQKAIRINRGDINLYIDLGIVYLQMGNKNLAKKAFVDALKIDPNNKTAKAGVVNSN